MPWNMHVIVITFDRSAVLKTADLITSFHLVTRSLTLRVNIKFCEVE